MNESFSENSLYYGWPILGGIAQGLKAYIGRFSALPNAMFLRTDAPVSEKMATDFDEVKRIADANQATVLLTSHQTIPVGVVYFGPILPTTPIEVILPEAARVTARSRGKSYTTARIVSHSDVGMNDVLFEE